MICQFDLLYGASRQTPGVHVCVEYAVVAVRVRRKLCRNQVCAKDYSILVLYVCLCPMKACLCPHQAFAFKIFPGLPSPQCALTCIGRNMMVCSNDTRKFQFQSNVGPARINCNPQNKRKKSAKRAQKSANGRNFKKCAGRTQDFRSFVLDGLKWKIWLVDTCRV